MKASEAFLKKKSIHTGAQMGHYLLSDLLDEFHKEQNKWNRLKLEQRKEVFRLKLIPRLEKHSKDVIREFFDYWTEHGETDNKMRFEKEKSFGIDRRLATWSRNNKGDDSGEVFKANTEAHSK